MRLQHVATAQEANANNGFAPWPAGDYDFEVHDACDEQSKASGRDQIKLTLYVFNEDGNKRTVFDYLGCDEKSAWKVRHFAEAVGLLDHYERGELDVNDIVGRTGRCRLRVKPESNGYPANNSVGDYVPQEAKEKSARPVARPSPAPARKLAPADLDDEIPF